MYEKNVLDKETLNDLKENYDKVRKLVDEDSKHDPATDPYVSRYAAKTILYNMKRAALGKYESAVVPWEKLKLASIICAINLNLGVIYMDTEEITTSEQLLTENINLYQEFFLEPEAIVVFINIYNNLGLLWSNREEVEKSKTFLLKGKFLYEEFKKTNKKPIDINDLFVNELVDDNKGAISFEKSHTLTLYYLAQVYGSLKDIIKSAVYCHITLRRQLEYDDYDPIDWALNSATLSQFFIEKNGFKQARHHLAAATFILHKYQASLMGETHMNEAYDAKVENLKHRSADVARCWIKYCLVLLSSSKNRLLLDQERHDDDAPKPLETDLAELNTGNDGSPSELSLDLSDTSFKSIDVTEFESKVTDKYLLTYSDAKPVFLACQEWINKAKEYYQKDTLASDYIQLVQDASQLFNHLSFFEECEERQAKMHKRRVDMLEELIKDINPTYYMQYCREIWYELGVTYCNLLNLKLDKLQQTNERPTPHALLKINNLAAGSIRNYQLYVDSYKDKSGKLPAKLDPENVSPIVVALSYIGRNYMKIISPDKKVQLCNYKKSFDAYKEVVDYCDGDSTTLNIMKQELSLCREMVSILPLKIERLESDLKN